MLKNIDFAFIEDAPVSIMVIDKDGKIVFVNKFFSHISNLKNPVGGNIFESKFFKMQKLCPRFRRLLATGNIFKKQGCVSEDGSKFLNLVAIPLKNSSGEVVGAVSMVSDISETVRAKLELKKINKNLKKKVLKKTGQLQKSNAKLKRMLQLKSQFISDASHELRTPLTMAKLNLEFFKSQFSYKNRGLLKILESVDNEINKVADTLSDLTMLTSIDEKSIGRMALEKIDLNMLIKEIIERAKILSASQKIKIIFEKEWPGLYVEGDKRKMEKLFLNIIRNSIKYGKKGGWIKISVAKDEEKNKAKIIFSDNGAGISAEDMPFIFDRFYRGNLPGKTAEGGFGLGLAICKWITDQHRGTIAAESILGKGSSFIISLPIGS